MFDDLKKRWISFLNAVLQPEPLFLLGTGTLLLWLSFNYKEDARFFVLVNLLAAILSGLGVAFIKGRYDATIQDSMLLKKGSSAVRNLESIGQQVYQIRKWTKLFASKKEKTKRDLEEIDRHLGTMEVHIKSGLEDWVDIVPELRKTEEDVNAYRELLRSHKQELLKTRRKLLELRGDNKNREQLEMRIKELEKTVRRIKEEQPVILNGELGVSGLPSSSIVSFGTGGTFANLASLDEKNCQRCGRRYKEDLTSISMLSSNLCPSCQQGGSILES